VFSTAVGRALLTFLCLWLAWIGLTGSIDPQELLIGALCAAVVASVSYGLLFRGSTKEKFQVKRWGYAIAYLPAYIWQEIKAHATVIRLILHPRMPIKPGIIKVPTGLRSDVGITGLANAITMTPGTLSVDVDEKEPSLYVHWIDITAPPEERGKTIAEPFERYLRRITE
jgi:multicomponent Na+:H+ antiporter subunit E